MTGNTFAFQNILSRQEEERLKREKEQKGVARFTHPTYTRCTWFVVKVVTTEGPCLIVHITDASEEAKIGKSMRFASYETHVVRHMDFFVKLKQGDSFNISYVSSPVRGFVWPELSMVKS